MSAHASGTKKSITTVSGSTATPMRNAVLPVGSQSKLAASGCSAKCGVRSAPNTTDQPSTSEMPIAPSATVWLSQRLRNVNSRITAAEISGGAGISQTAKALVSIKLPLQQAHIFNNHRAAAPVN